MQKNVKECKRLQKTSTVRCKKSVPLNNTFVERVQMLVVNLCNRVKPLRAPAAL